MVSCLFFQPVSATGSAPAISSPSSSKDFKDFEDELNANREIVSFLQIQLDELTKELESRFVLKPYTCFEPRSKEPVFGFSNRSNTNRAVQPQKIAGGLKFQIKEVEGLYYVAKSKFSHDLAHLMSELSIYIIFKFRVGYKCLISHCCILIEIPVIPTFHWTAFSLRSWRSRGFSKIIPNYSRSVDSHTIWELHASSTLPLRFYYASVMLLSRCSRFGCVVIVLLLRSRYDNEDPATLSLR